MNSKLKKNAKALRSVLLAIAALGLASCTNTGSISVEQEGALRTGTYPTFGKVPQGETKQFTKAEQEQMVGDLQRAKATQGPAASAGISRAELAARKRQLQDEAEETLKAIETGQ